MLKIIYIKVIVTKLSLENEKKYFNVTCFLKINFMHQI